MAHTFGTYKAEKNLRGSGWYVRQKQQGRLLASVNEQDAGIESEECEANAMLFAAAPDLLAALEQLNSSEFFIANMSQSKKNQAFCKEVQARARAAIEKARGVLEEAK